MSTAVHRHELEHPRDASWAVTWTRRSLSIPAVLIGAAMALVAAPLWLPLAAGIDLFRRPRCALRFGLFLTVYLWCETLGLLASGLIWLASGAGRGEAARRRCRRWSFALQQRWAGVLFSSARRIFGFRLEVAGGEHLAEAPLLLFLRHASVADTLLPAVLVSAPHGIRLRYVMKRELLWDPCLDVVGHRLPNHFARRDSDDSEGERQAVAELARDLGSDEGVLIYPEGTRFTPAKRTRVLDRLRRGGHSDLHSRAERLERVLPPRLGGPLAMLEASPGVDVVFGAHAGFEGVGSLGDLWNGVLVDATVRARFWRVPAAEIPPSREARAAWLYEQWSRMDRSVAALQESVV